MQKGNLDQIIGNTPLIKIKSLSDLTGCQIWGKAEFLNPGGSIKDRTALGIINQAENTGQLKPGFTLVEGTAGNTGIGLSQLANLRGYKSVVVMPNNQSQEKYDILKALGAELVLVNPVPFSNENHFYHLAKKISEQSPNSFWLNQFENTANFKIHFETTGPEIWQQINQKINYFVCSSGTGGTISGVSQYLKQQNSDVKIVLADPYGSGLYSYFKNNVIAAMGSSITEGIGIMRLTENFKKALIDDVLQVSDQEMINMLYHLAQKDGLLVGTSAALNVFGAYKLAQQNLNTGKTIVTVLCDSALRYQSKIFNPKFLDEKGLKIGSI